MLVKKGGEAALASSAGTLVAAKNREVYPSASVASKSAPWERRNRAMASRFSLAAASRGVEPPPLALIRAPAWRSNEAVLIWPLRAAKIKACEPSRAGL